MSELELSFHLIIWLPDHSLSKVCLSISVRLTDSLVSGQPQCLGVQTQLNFKLQKCSRSLISKQFQKCHIIPK
jgi:hypothetical protein